MTQTQEINKRKSKDVDIIKIDFILDLEIWVILQQSDQEAADCSHVSEREREKESTREKTEKNKKKKNLKISIYTLCYNTPTIKSRFFFLLFLLSIQLQINQNYKSFDQYKTFKDSPT